MFNLNKTLPDRVGDRMCPIGQVKTASHIVKNVSDGTLGIAEFQCDLTGIESVGGQSEHVDLPGGQPAQVEPHRGKHVTLESRHLLEQPGQHV